MRFIFSAFLALCFFTASGQFFGPQTAILENVDYSSGRNSFIPLDFDQDGDTDLLGGSPFKIHLNDGAGGFAQTAPFAYTFSQMHDAADLDGDGDMDVLAKDVWFKNDGPNGWDSQPLDCQIAFFCADLDQDGDSDIVGASQKELFLFKNSGAGLFEKSLLFAAADFIVDCKPTDWDGNGRDDLIVEFFGGGKVARVLLGADLAPSAKTLAITGMSSAVAPADLDSDGDIDLVFYSSSSGRMVAAFNDGTDNFTMKNTPLTHTIRAFRLLDIDGDGDQDLVCAKESDFEFEIGYALHDGTGGFGAFEKIGACQLILSYYGELKRLMMNVADLNADGRPDLFFNATYDKKLFFWQGLTTGPTAATEAKKTPLFDLFPNPASDEIFVKMPDGHALVRLEIVEAATGRTVFFSKNEGVSATVDLSALAAGAYFLRLHAAGGGVSARLFFKN